MNRTATVAILTGATVIGFFGAGGPAVASATAAAAKPLFVIKDKKMVGSVCKTQKVYLLKVSKGFGPIRLQVGDTMSVSATYSTSTGLSAGMVSAGVGFDVKKEYAFSSGATYDVPKGKMGHLEAYPCFNKYTFKYYLNNGAYAGKGTAEKPIGLYFKKYLTKK